MSVNEDVRKVLEERSEDAQRVPKIEREGRSVLLFRGGEFPLDSEYEHPDPQDPERLSSPYVLALLDSFSSYFGFEDAEDERKYIREFEDDISPPDPRIPFIVDRRRPGNPTVNQGSRYTCVAFATAALLERHRAELALSPEAAYYHFSADRSSCPSDDFSIRTERAPRVLQSERICREHELPYRRLIGLERAIAKNSLRPSPDPEAWFGIASGSVEELNREAVQNTRVLEAVLAAGLDIVVALATAWDDQQADPLRPAWNATNADHTLLLVGYDRNSRVFFAQNSWENQAHLNLHYDCAPALFQYGFTVDSLLEVDRLAYQWPPLPAQCDP